MEHEHLDAADLEHLLATDRTAKQNAQLFHLLAVCPRCREVGGWLLELRQANALPPVFGLIDATLALLLQIDGDSLVIPALNRDGDLLSDLVLQMFGSIAGSESLVLAFDDPMHIKVVMSEAPHGTAPALEGKNIANPMAMILAGAAILSYIETAKTDQVSRAIYESVFEAVHDGKATTDIGGRLSTTEFTDEVIRRVRTKLEVWSGLRS